MRLYMIHPDFTQVKMLERMCLRINEIQYIWLNGDSLWLPILKLFFFCFWLNIICQSEANIITPGSPYLQRCQAFLMQFLLCLPGWLSSPEGSAEMFLPQEAFSSAVIKGTMQRSTLHGTHSVGVIFVFPRLLFVSSLRTVFPIRRTLERSLSCKFIFSVKTIWVAVTAKLSVFFQSHLLSFFFSLYLIL